MVTYILLLPIMVFGYFIFCILYNILKAPKRYKELFHKVKTGNFPATWIGIPIFFWCCLYFYFYYI